MSYLDYRASPSLLTVVPDSRVLSIYVCHMFWGQTFLKECGLSWHSPWPCVADPLDDIWWYHRLKLLPKSTVVKPCIHRPRNAFAARRMSPQYLHFRLFKVVVLNEIRRRRRKKAA